MPISRVDYYGTTLIDLTGDTVTAGRLLQGTTAHDAAGNAIVGTYEGGGGSTTLIGTDKPLPNVGNDGDYYIQYLDYKSLPAMRRTYDLTIIAGLRDTSVLTFVGSQDLDLIFDDGSGNEVSIRSISDFTYSGKTGTGNTTNCSSAFDSNLSSYWEANPTPVDVYMSATVPAGYIPKYLQSYQRTGTYKFDVWSDFTVTEEISGNKITIADYQGLKIADWAGAGNPTQFIFNALKNEYLVVATYVKINGEWAETDKINVIFPES